MKENIKLFISAYACEPDLGSEMGVGWNWSMQLSAHFKLWVLTRESNRRNIEQWYALHPEAPEIRFVYYDLPVWARRWKRGLRGVHLYYLLWQWGANRKVKQVMIENQITLFHHLTYGNALWSVSQWGRKQTFIWGPIGGLETIPADFTKKYGLKERIRQSLRRFVARTIDWNPWFILRCKQARWILCKTEATYQCIPQCYRNKACLMTDVAINELPMLPKLVKDEGFSLLAVGRLEAWRGFDLLIEAVARLKSDGVSVHLTLLGDGPDRGRLIKWINRFQLQEEVTLMGKVDTESYEQYMREATVVVNSALKEAAVTVSMDALAHGKPLIALDGKGFVRSLPKGTVVVVPILYRLQVVEDLASAIRRMLDVNYRQTMENAARKGGVELSWRKKGEEIASQIEKIYAAQ
jgi:glycosyltransferase involved in cell wall biosynthesis